MGQTYGDTIDQAYRKIFESLMISFFEDEYDDRDILISEIEQLKFELCQRERKLSITVGNFDPLIVFKICNGLVEQDYEINIDDL